MCEKCDIVTHSLEWMSDARRRATYVFIIIFVLTILAGSRALRNCLCHVLLSLRTLPSALIPNLRIQSIDRHSNCFLRFRYLDYAWWMGWLACTWIESRNLFKSLPTSVAQVAKRMEDELPHIAKHTTRELKHTPHAQRHRMNLFDFSRKQYKYNRISNLRVNAKPNRRHLSTAVSATNRTIRKITSSIHLVRVWDAECGDGGAEKPSEKDVVNFKSVTFCSTSPCLVLLASISLLFGLYR